MHISKLIDFCASSCSHTALVCALPTFSQSQSQELQLENARNHLRDALLECYPRLSAQSSSHSILSLEPSTARWLIYGVTVNVRCNSQLFFTFASRKLVLVQGRAHCTLRRRGMALNKHGSEIACLPTDVLACIVAHAQLKPCQLMLASHTSRAFRRACMQACCKICLLTGRLSRGNDQSC